MSGCNDLNVRVSMHCPRCKHPLAADDPEALADDMLAHLREVHAHEPPREHVLARIAQQNHGEGKPMASETAVQDEECGQSECWCCGQLTPSGQLVRLDNHPEVALCLRCARFVAHRAREIEDRQRTGPAVLAREVVRRVRGAVVDHGWHNKAIVGPGLRWLGHHLP